MGNVLSSERYRCSPCRASSHVATLLWGCHGSGRGTQRCGRHMGASVRWEWGQGEVRACAGAGEGVLAGCLGRGCSAFAWPPRRGLAVMLWGGVAVVALAARQGSVWPHSWGKTQQLKPGLGALGAACPAAVPPCRGCQGRSHRHNGTCEEAARGSARHGPVTQQEPANVSASEYCSSLSLSGEIKKKREPSFLECNLPPATRSHVN